jgi:hypothetical protein
MCNENASLANVGGEYEHKNRINMTFFKLMTTTTIVGLTCTAAFANEINFSQSNGDVNSVAFTQTGVAGGNSINSNTIDSTDPANPVETAAASTVTGSLAKLSIEQNGGNNAASFDITTTAASVGTVEILTTGSNNTSDLTVNQSGSETLAFAVGVEGDNNSVTANIAGVSSVVNLESYGNNVAYNLSQTGADTNITYSQTIIANVAKTGDDLATVDLIQSGANNTINLGTPSEFGTFTGGIAGLTLLGAADVDITQSATLASYDATLIVPAGGSLTVVQSD